MQLHKNVIKSESLDVLRYFQSHKAFASFYLAGGTALALQIGHRESIDLDLFTPHEFSPSIIKYIDASQFTQYQEIMVCKNSIDLLVEKTKVFFWYYAFPLERPLLNTDSFRLADPIDTGLMKLLAVQSRSTRKDIIDLYFIDKHFIKLELLLHIFEQVHKAESFNTLANVKRMFDFEKLEMDEMPKMLVDVDWEDCLHSVTKKISSYLSIKIT